MLKNYFRVALRNILKNRVYAFINIAGLATGIACSILILLWVADELSFDKFHPKAERLYQVWINATYDGKVNSWTSVPLPTYEAMKSADSHIQNTAVADWGGDHLITVDDTKLIKRAYFVSPEFLEMFEFPLVKGDARTVLDDPMSVVVTESMAKALFGDEDPINKVVRINNASDVKVTGVLKDIPSNSSFQFDYLLTWALKENTQQWVKEGRTNWGNYSFQVYLQLDDAASEAGVETAIRDMLHKNGQTDMKREFFLHPLLRWRLYSDFENGHENGGMIDYVQMFTVIAVFILMIACINFMNLATARSERRAKEVGIRKSVGSRKAELVFQFIGESLFISFASCVIALVLAQLLLPFYNQLVDKNLFIDYSSPAFWIFTLTLIFFTGVVSGSYPAFYLSSFQPAKVLKGKAQAGRGASTPRKVLVTLQFGFSMLLIIGTIVVYQQIQHVKNRDLGYQQENLIAIRYTEEIGKSYKVIKQELLQSNAVEAVTKSNSAITQIMSNNFIGWPGKPDDVKVLFTTVATEYDYTRTMGIKVLEGRDFSEDFASDSSAIIVNQRAVDVMGLKEPVLGTELTLWGGNRKLIGVIDDVLMGSVYDPVKPMFMVLIPDWVDVMTVRLEATNDLPGALKTVEEIFRKYNPAYPFEYKFADVEFAKKYETINMTGKLANLFAFLAIMITGLGLFGLAAFTAEQRTKEIGIRKVLGASVASVVMLMSRDFSKLVVLSFLLSAPVAWWLLQRYLERYPIRVDIAWYIFPITGLMALLFALAIVATQALRAAYANPVNSLRNE